MLARRQGEVPVVITAALWETIEAISPRCPGIAGVRERRHALLWTESRP